MFLYIDNLCMFAIRIQAEPHRKQLRWTTILGRLKNELISERHQIEEASLDRIEGEAPADDIWLLQLYSLPAQHPAKQSGGYCMQIKVTSCSKPCNVLCSLFQQE